MTPIKLGDPLQRTGVGLGFVVFQKFTPVGLTVDVKRTCQSRRWMDHICSKDVLDEFLLEFGGGCQAQPVCVYVCFVWDSQAVI